MQTFLIRGLLSLACCLLVPSAPVFAQGKGKPTPPPPPPLPPIAYLVQFWDFPVAGNAGSAYRLNYHGQVVGRYNDAQGFYRGFLYDPAVNHQQAIDVQAAYGAPPGWRISMAASINDHGIIVGWLVPENQPTHTPRREGFILDTQSDTPVVTMLPNWGAWVQNYPIDINENGDILGTYEENGVFSSYLYNPADPAPPIPGPSPVYSSLGNYTLNNPVKDASGAITRPAQVTGHFANNGPAFRWTAGWTTEVFPTTINRSVIGDINDSGTLCGQAEVTETIQGTGKKTTTVTATYPMRMPAGTSTPQLLKGDPNGWNAASINSAADTLIMNRLNLVSTLYRDDWGAYGYYADVNKLLVFANDEDKAMWFSTAAYANCTRMSDRQANANAGYLLGYWYAKDGSYYRGCLMTPVPAP